MIDPAIKTRIESLTPAYAELVKSNFAHELAFSLGEFDQFDEQQKTVLSNGIMLYLLLFLTFDELVDFISTECRVATDHANRLAGAVLASLPDDFSKIHNNTYEAINANEVPHTEEVSKGLASDIAETEATLKAIPHVRTMAKDMRQSQAVREITYSSTQEAILKEGRSSSDKTSPQWGSVN